MARRAERMRIEQDLNAWERQLVSAVNNPHDGRCVFVVGSGLSFQTMGETKKGVWSVGEFIDAARTILRGAGVDDEELARAGNYGSIMELLARDHGNVENIVRRAVLNARVQPGEREPPNGGGKAQAAYCRASQWCSEGWFLPPAVRALASICRHISQCFSWKDAINVDLPAIVTTNFDGLLELALLQAHVPYVTHNLALDTEPHDSGECVSIWHVHGWWLGNVTRHHQQDLADERPKVEAALRSLFREHARVFVLGYGAWDDAVFRTLSNVIVGDANHQPYVSWAFYEGDEREIPRKYPHVEKHIGTATGDRIRFFCGVDVHERLPKVASGLDPGRWMDLPDEMPWLSGSIKRDLVDSAPMEQRTRLVDLLNRRIPDLGYFKAVVEHFCGILEGMSGAERERFGRHANAVIRALGEYLMKPDREALRATTNGLPRQHQIPVPYGPKELVRIWLSVGLGKDLNWANTAMFDGQTETLKRADGQDWVSAFKEFLWTKLRPGKPYDSEDPAIEQELHGELEKRFLRGDPAYVNRIEGADSVDWAAIARDLLHVTILVCPQPANPDKKMAEELLADWLRRFIELAFKTKK